MFFESRLFFLLLRFFSSCQLENSVFFGSSPDHHFPTNCGPLVLWGGQSSLVRQMGTWRCCISDEQSKKIVLGECWCCSREKKKKRASMLSNLVFVAAAATWTVLVFFGEGVLLRRQKKPRGGKTFFFLKKKKKNNQAII